MWSLGIGVWWSTAASLISSLLSKLKARSTYFENKTGTKVILQEIDGAELLEKASIITTPTAYSDGVLHSVKPSESPYADFTFTRNDAGTRVNASGNIESVGVDLPRIDYLGGSGSWLLEPQSQNLIQYSEDFSQGSYFTITSASVSSSTITDPTENQNSFKLIPDNGTGGNRSIGRNFLNLTNLHTFTCFAKKAEYNYLMLRTRNGPNTAVMFNLDNGTYNVNATSASFVSAKIDDYGNGWYRCSITLDPSQMNTVGQLFVSLSVGITGNETNSFSGDGVSGVYIFGMQFEEQSYSTSYIPTSEGTGTRAADIATDAGSSDLISSTEGVLYAEISALTNDGTYRILSLNDSSINKDNRVYIQYTDIDNTLSAVVKSVDGTTRVNKAVVLTDSTEFHKVAFKYKANDFSLWINGTEYVGTPINGGGVPIGLNKLSFDDGLANNFYGNVKCVAVFKEALTDAELTDLTTI